MPSPPPGPLANLDARREDEGTSPCPPTPGGTGAELELTELGHGTAAVVAFSTVAGLVAQLGRDQPWVMLPASTALAAGRHAAAVVLDPAPGVCAPRWSAPRVSALAEEVRRDHLA